MSEIQANAGRDYQFRLWQLFLWVFACALVPAIRQATLSSPEAYFTPTELMQRLNRISMLMTGLQSPVYGTYIAGTIIGLWHLRAHRKFPVHPGHVLLIIECTVLAISILIQLLAYAFISAQWDSTLLFYALNILVAGIRATAYVWAGRRLVFEKRWRLLFAGVAACEACEVVLAMWGIAARFSSSGSVFVSYRLWWIDDALSVFETTVILSLLVIACYRDLRFRVTRDWLHWVAVASVALDHVVGSLGQVGFSLVQMLYAAQQAR